MSKGAFSFLLSLLRGSDLPIFSLFVSRNAIRLQSQILESRRTKRIIEPHRVDKAMEVLSSWKT